MQARTVTGETLDEYHERNTREFEAANAANGPSWEAGREVYTTASSSKSSGGGDGDGGKPKRKRKKLSFTRDSEDVVEPQVSTASTATLVLEIAEIVETSFMVLAARVAGLTTAIILATTTSTGTLSDTPTPPQGTLSLYTTTNDGGHSIVGLEMNGKTDYFHLSGDPKTKTASFRHDPSALSFINDHRDWLFRLPDVHKPIGPVQYNNAMAVAWQLVSNGNVPYGLYTNCSVHASKILNAAGYFPVGVQSPDLLQYGFQFQNVPPH